MYTSDCNCPSFTTVSGVITATDLISGDCNMYGQQSLSTIVERINSDWRATEAIKNWIINDEWQTGFTEVDSGSGITVLSGGVPVRYDVYKMDHNQLQFGDSIVPSGFSNLWLFVSGGIEDVGKELYEKIANIVQNTRDIDYCEIKSLRSIASELNANQNKYLSYEYPLVLEKLINIFSIKRDNVLKHSGILTNESLTSIRNASLSSISNLADISVFDSSVEFIGNAETSAYSNIEQYAIDDSKYLQLIEDTFNVAIKNILFTDCGIILKNIKNNVELTSDDDEYIVSLKDQLNIPQSFDANGAANDITFGKADISSYSSTEQIIINVILTIRAQSKTDNGVVLGNVKTLRVKELIKFIEDITYYNSNINSAGNIDFDISSIPTFFSDVSGTPISGAMIETASKILKNMCIEISYQRDYLKQLAQKYALIGTDTILTNMIKEFLFRTYTSKEFWRLDKFDAMQNIGGMISNELSALISIQSSNLDNLIVNSNIEVVEYGDNTEYLNIESKNDFSSENRNPRYWEGYELTNNIERSEHTQEEILKFYKNAGFVAQTDKDGTIENSISKEWEALTSLLNTIYDYSALSASNEVLSLDTLITSGTTFGKYGAYTFNGSTLSLSADIEPTYIYNTNIHTSGFLNSNILSGIPSGELYNKWIETPVLSAWNYNLTSIIDVMAQPQFKAYIDNTFSTVSWIPNQYTPAWKRSVLMTYWQDSYLINEWNNAYNSYSGVVSSTINYFKSVDLVNNNTYGWKNVPEVIAHSPVYPLSQATWDSYGLVSGFVEAPVTKILVNNSYTPDQFNNTPFKLNLYNSPFDRIVSNNDEIVTVTDDKSQIYDLLNANNLIDTNDIKHKELAGVYDKTPDGVSLLPIYQKYMGSTGYINGTNLAANDKNKIHPSFATTPFIWNLIELKKTYNKLFGKLKNITMTEYDYQDGIKRDNLFNVADRISNNGNIKNSWKRGYEEFTPTISFYEDSTKSNETNDSKAIFIDRDGPWIWEALSGFITAPSTSAYINTLETQPYLKHIIFSSGEINKIKSQLELYGDEIKSLSGKTIYQYSTDKFGNSYTLFKDVNTFDAPGNIWMRYKNHPFSFPLIGYSLSGNTNTPVQYNPFDYTNIDTDFSKCQIDVSNYISYLPQTAYKCYDFEIFNNGYMIAFGADCNSNSEYSSGCTTPLIGPAISGVVSLHNIEEIYNISDKKNRLSALQAGSGFEGWVVNPNEKFIGWYRINNKIQLATVSSSSAIVVGGDSYFNIYSYYNTWSNGKTSVSGIVGGVYNIPLRLQSFDIDNDETLDIIKNIKNIYNEKLLTPSDINFHNNFKLTFNSSTVAIAYEFEHNVNSNNYYINSLNEYITFDNENIKITNTMGVSIIELYNIDANNVFGDGSYFIDNFIPSMTEVGHIPIIPGVSINAEDDTYTNTTSGTFLLNIPAISGVLPNDIYDLDIIPRIKTQPLSGIVTFNIDGSFEYEHTFTSGQLVSAYVDTFEYELYDTYLEYPISYATVTISMDNIVDWQATMLENDRIIRDVNSPLGYLLGGALNPENEILTNSDGDILSIP